MITAYWPPHRGGIETVVHEQACRLVENGHQVAIVTSQLPGDDQMSTHEGFPVYRVAATNALEQRRGIPYPLFSPRLWPLLGRLAREHDVIVVHNHSYISSVVGALAARVRRRPMVLIQYSPFVQYHFPWNAVEHGADYLLGRFTLRSAHRVLAISEHTRDYVQRLIGTRPVELIHLGVDTRRFRPVESPGEKLRIRARLGLPEQSFVLFTARRLVFRNGLDTLLEAALRLERQRDIVIVIGGRGPERETLECFIRQHGINNVRLVGFIPDDLLPDYYRAADCFILPSRTGEGFGLVVLEAFASGIPAVATRGGGQEEVVEHGRTGLLVPPASPDPLTEAVLALRAAPQRATAMGLAARAAAVKVDWGHCVDRLTHVLEQVVAAA